MGAPSKKQLRALPTLTEVVPLPTAAPISALASAPAPALEETQDAPDSPEVQAIVEQVIQRLEVNLQGYIREALEPLILLHISEIEPRLRQKVVMTVRQAVAKTVVAVVKENEQGGSGLNF